MRRFRAWRLRRALAALPPAAIVSAVAEHLTNATNKGEAAELLGRRAFDMAWQVMSQGEGKG